VRERERERESRFLTTHQHIIGYTVSFTLYMIFTRWTADKFLQVKRPNQQVLKEMLRNRKKTTKTTKHTYPQTIMYTQKDIHKISTTSPLVYTRPNMG